jgi:putative heme-binding domain-containing protein
MPANSIVYLTATLESSVATSALLTTGSDDGLHIWLNGKSVVEKDVDRGLHANGDKATVQLTAGKNILLLKLINHSGAAGIQARVRSKPTEFDPEELAKSIGKIPTPPASPSPTKGRALFESVGCMKCHTTDSHEAPRGPYLGDAGAKHPVPHMVESILRPSAKIAQGFTTERILAKSDPKASSTEYLGFIVKESPDQIELRDITGKISVVQKTTITKRQTMPGSVMPEGLADTMSLDDFANLIAYLRSLK